MRIAGLILAGGAGRRMGGRDKAGLELGGQSLLARTRARLGGQVGLLALSSNRERQALAGLGLDLGMALLPDPAFCVGAGPLAGILAGLCFARESGAEAVVSVAVDTPFLPLDLVARLVQAAQSDTGLGAACARSLGRDHYACALWPLAAEPALAAQLKRGEYRLGAALAGAVRVAFDGEPDPFWNLNTPQDLAQAQAWLQGPGAAPGTAVR